MAKFGVNPCKTKGFAQVSLKLVPCVRHTDAFSNSARLVQYRASNASSDTMDAHPAGPIPQAIGKTPIARSSARSGRTRAIQPSARLRRRSPHLFAARGPIKWPA